MDERVKRIKTPEGCKRFAKNAVEHDRPDLALEAHRRAVELKAQEYGAETQAERECLQAIYAYEETLTRKNGRTTRASRT
jgi:hypothetical protein